MWSDNETTIDYLNFGVVADACAKLLQQAKGVPLSVGVSGGWGVGKTSLVRMIEDRLKQADAPGNNTYVVVTFNPWLYQDFEGARSALLQLIGDEVLRLAAKNEALLKKAKRLLKRINLLRLAQLGGEAAATLYTGVPVGSIGAAVMKVGGFFGLGGGDGEPGEGDSEKGKDDEGAADGLLKPAEPVSLPSEIQAFRNALEELLEELKVTLVVFVDDLDRFASSSFSRGALSLSQLTMNSFVELCACTSRAREFRLKSRQTTSTSSSRYPCMFRDWASTRPRRTWPCFSWSAPMQMATSTRLASRPQGMPFRSACRQVGRAMRSPRSSCRASSA